MPQELLEVLWVVSSVTIICLLAQIPFRVVRDIYLLVVLVLSLRVGRGPALIAALCSGIIWDFLFIPPRFAFQVLTIEDGLILGSYFMVALVASEMTTRLRASELRERQRTEHATTLLKLTRTLADADSLEIALAGGLQLSDQLFRGNSALLLRDKPSNSFKPFHGSTFQATASDLQAITRVLFELEPSDNGVRPFGTGQVVFAPLLGSGEVLGAFVVSASSGVLDDDQRHLLRSFASQMSLVIEREHLREARERERLLAESDRLRRTLLDSVSHELKTPLAILRAAAECLKTDDPAQRQALAQEIGQATQRLDRLVANLLNQARLEAGAIQPQLDWCDARDIVANVRRALAYALSGRTLTVKIAPSLPLIKVDEPLMEQALENLLLNASLHTPPATPLELSLGVDSIRHSVFIAVIDHGPGIPAAMFGSLFQKFRRGTSAAAGGVGLGLSIVRGFVEAQGGEVVAENRPHGGAKFTIFLPLLFPVDAPEE